MTPKEPACSQLLLDCYYSPKTKSIAEVVGTCTDDAYSIMEQIVAEAWGFA